MRQKHSWLALVALLIILIDCHAQKHFPNKNGSKIVSDNHNDLSSKAFANCEFDDVYGNKIDGVKKKTEVNSNLNEFNSISGKSNSISDKKLVVAGVDGSVFSYPLSSHKRKMVDGRYWPTENNLSRPTLPLMRAHTDMKFPQLPREIVGKQQSVHVTTEVTTRSTNQRVKDDTHMKINVNMKNKTASESETKYWHLKNWKSGKNKKNVRTENSPVECEIPSGKIFTSNQFVKLPATQNNKNINIKQLQSSSTRRIINPFRNRTPKEHYQSLSIDKGIKSTAMKTPHTTLGMPLKVFAKLSSLPPCVKPLEKSLSDEEYRDKNQSIKREQQIEFPVNTEFSKISVIMKTFSPTTESNNKYYQDNDNSEINVTENLDYNIEAKDITSTSTFFKQKREMNKGKKSAMSKVALALNPGKIDKELLFESKKNIYPKKVTHSIVRSNKSLNSIASELTTSKDYQLSSHISGQLGHSNQFLSPSESYNISLISAMTNPRSSDIQEPAQSSVIKSNRKLQSDANISQTVELYSDDYILHEEDTRNIIPLDPTVTTTTNIEDLTSQIATVTLSDKELPATVDAFETTATTETFHRRNPTKPKLKWSMLSDNVGPIISALSINHEKLLPKERAIIPQISQILRRDKINKIPFNNSLHNNVHQHLSNTTFNDNYERHIIASEYRLSIPLANTQLDVTQRGTEIGDMKIQSYNVASSDRNVDNTTVKSTFSNYPQIESKKMIGIKQNNHDSVTNLSTNVNGISDMVFNDSANRMSLSTLENVLTIVHSDTRMLDDHGSKLENSTRISLNQWPVKHSAIVEGNLVLGGLMMVHEREDTVTCGPVMAQGGVQALEAMLYTLDWINERDIVPGVKIGAHILDDCDKDTYGLEMAVDFIKGSISNIDGAEYNCNKTTVRKVISGVVGAASSVTSIQVANLLRLFRIPQVSFFSTSPELSNKQRFEYFTRTIPSDHHQVQAMVDIIKKMGWSYVSIIYEESNYGIKAYEELEDLLAKNQICIAIKEKLAKDSGVADAYAYDNIVQKLLTKPRARGCIIFGSDQEVAGVMRAVRRNNATGAFYWIGSDGWSARGLVSNKNEPEVEGTLSVQPQANPVDGFEEYFLNLTVENNKRNPWFSEFWEDHFQCRYPNTSLTPYNRDYITPCTTKERLTKQNTAFEDQLQFVSDAVMAFAYAFRDMHADLCHGKAGLCDAMRPTKGIELLKYLRKVEFQGLSGDNFHFDKNGDGPARYNIIHFKQISPGKFKWIRVGKYLEGELRLNMSEIQFRLDNSHAPESVCSLPCRVGQAKKYVEGESCCWHCLDCTQYQIRHETDQTRCIPCPWGTLPDETHSYCRDIPEEFLKPDSGWAIGAMSFSASGILITLFVGGVFVKHNDTPIVRASGRELSYVLLIGILLCYLVTFTLVLKPTDVVCGIQRFAAGFCFTVVYAALLTKTNRISRIFNKSKKSAKRPSFISPRSQLIICSLLVGIQILINAVWMVIDPAKARHHYPMREDNLLVCNSYIDASYMIAFSYPIILIVVCTVYAVLTRKIPEDFNESKHIGFTMYTTCVIWLAFVPLYFGTGNHVALRITSMSVTISLSASVTIACLFSPKLYIILIHPERNIRRGRGPFALKSTTNITKTNASSMISTVTLTAATCDQNKAVKAHTIATIDCSTQSELYEMEMKDRKNGKLPLNSITRSTQTLMNNNGKEINVVLSPTMKDINMKESFGSVKSLNLSRIGNGPVNQNDVVL